MLTSIDINEIQKQYLWQRMKDLSSSETDRQFYEKVAETQEKYLQKAKAEIDRVIKKYAKQEAKELCGIYNNYKIEKERDNETSDNA